VDGNDPSTVYTLEVSDEEAPTRWRGICKLLPTILSESIGFWSKELPSTLLLTGVDESPIVLQTTVTGDEGGDKLISEACGPLRCVVRDGELSLSFDELRKNERMR